VRDVLHRGVDLGRPEAHSSAVESRVLTTTHEGTNRVP
jgi:hypothetical protein